MRASVLTPFTRLPFTSRLSPKLNSNLLISSYPSLKQTSTSLLIKKRYASTEPHSKADLKEWVNSLPENEKRILIQKLKEKQQRKGSATAAYYVASIGVFFLALGYAAVPVYRAICQRTGWAGTPITDSSKFTRDKLIPVDTNKRITVNFSGETSAILPWKFTPQQRNVRVKPGETALAFYKARNNSDQDIIGMATYSVTPEIAAQYFNKIQCFCFEEQKLLAGEEVDMPVFFFLDPEFANDPQLRNVQDIVLHYTFFKAHYNGDGQISPDTAINFTPTEKEIKQQYIEH